jgi:hypothetical protein
MPSAKITPPSFMRDVTWSGAAAIRPLVSVVPVAMLGKGSRTK